MGAKGWMLVYADGDVPGLGAAAVADDPVASRAVVERLYAGRRITPIEEPGWRTDPPDGTVHVGSFPGLTFVLTSDAAGDHPSMLDSRFLDEGKGLVVHSLALHSVVDWFAYAVWGRDGVLRRSLSLSPDTGVVEDIGAPMAFEEPYWAGEHPVGDGYPLAFHPLDLAEAAMGALFGFHLEGPQTAFAFEELTFSGFTVE